MNEIVRLAMEFGLSSRETSWVVVEKREVPLTEETSLRRVPIAITNGWGGRDTDTAQLSDRDGGDVTPGYGDETRRVRRQLPRPAPSRGQSGTEGPGSQGRAHRWRRAFSAGSVRVCSRYRRRVFSIAW